MSLDTNALIKSAGIGTVIALVLSVISQVISLMLGVDTLSPTDATAIAGPLMIVSTCLCCVGYAVYAAVGVGYAFFAQQNGTSLDPGPMALGGGVSAVIVSVIQSVFGAILFLLFGTQALSESLGQFDTTEMMGPMLAGGFIGLVIGFCIAFVLSAALGAGGGAAYAAIVKSRAEAV